MIEHPDVFIVAGEASGDLIGSLLVKQLRRQKPDIQIAGVGGDQMEEAGTEIQFNIVRDLAIIGLTEVIANYGKIRKLFRDTVRYLRERRPKVVVLIDYPGFNLRLAREARGLGLKVIYYVVPQVWAWHKSRVHQLRKFADLALVILPFEEKFLRDAGVNAEYVGHPLLDVMILTMDRARVFEKFGLDPTRKLIGLLPGSRKREIESLLPVMLKAAEIMHERLPETQFVIPRASTIRPEQIERHLASSRLDVKVVDSFRYNVRSVMDFALVASGTATLETGLLLCPMIILYRVSALTWLLARMLVKIENIGLINIVAGEKVVPEVLQDQCDPRNVSEKALEIMDSPAEILRIKSRLAEVKEKMGGSGASRRTAQRVIELLNGAADTRTQENEAL